MKTTLLLSFFTVFSISLSAQTIPSYYYCDHGQFFHWGDYNYYYNLDGIGSLMLDLQREDAELFEILRPEYQALRKQHQEANAILGVGLGAGMIMLIAGILSSGTESRSGYPGQTGSLDSPPFNWGLVLGGSGIALASSLIYQGRRVDHQDLLHFTNQFNQYSEGDKIMFSMKPDVGFGNGASAGISFSLVF